MDGTIFKHCELDKYAMAARIKVALSKKMKTMTQIYSAIMAVRYCFVK